MSILLLVITSLEFGATDNYDDDNIHRENNNNADENADSNDVKTLETDSHNM